MCKHSSMAFRLISAFFTTIILVSITTLSAPEHSGADTPGIPDKALTHYNYGLEAWSSASNDRELDEAIHHFETARILAPDWPDVYFRLGMVRKDRRHDRQALSDFRKYLHLDPDGIFASQAREWVDRLEYRLSKGDTFDCGRSDIRQGDELRYYLIENPGRPGMMVSLMIERIVDKDGSTLLMDWTRVVNGFPVNSGRHRFSLDDPSGWLARPPGVVTATGTETLFIAGRYFKCRWETRYEQNAQPNALFESYWKVWYSDDAPWQGRVVMEYTQVETVHGHPPTARTVAWELAGFFRP